MNKVYLETTIPSYLAAEPSRDVIVLAHQELTRQWWQNEKNRFELYTSNVVFEEISQGNELSSIRRMEYLKSVKLLSSTSEVESILIKYMKHYNLNKDLTEDMLHIAYSVYYQMDYLLTWNCKHIANAHFRTQLERYNNELGYKTPVICTPEELVSY